MSHRPCFHSDTDSWRWIDGANVNNETVAEDVDYECVRLAYASTHRVVEHHFIVIINPGEPGVGSNH